MELCEIGDPATVDLLDASLPWFRAGIAGANPLDTAYLVATASLYSDPAEAYSLLRKFTPRVAPRDFYHQQLRVWKSRREGRSLDTEYLRITLNTRSPGDRKARAKTHAPLASERQPFGIYRGEDRYDEESYP